MTTIVSTIQQIVRQELRGIRVAELGVVEDVFPHAGNSDNDNYGCDVRMSSSGLLLKQVPVATGHIGTAAIPNVGDVVLLTFDQGDVNHPLVIGRLYNADDRPPLNKPDEVIFRLPLAESDDKTIKAAVRNHASDSPPREVILEMSPKVTLRITDGTVRAAAGNTELKLDQPGGSGGTVTVMAGRTKITLNQDGDVTIEAAGSMTLEATGDLTLKGMNVTVQGQMNASMEAGMSAKVKGNMSAGLEGGLSASVQGATVALKGMTAFSP